MKKERFFRLLGDLDDHILEQYRQMDTQLSLKILRKKRALRVLIIAACLALVIGACVPVGMMIAGRLEEESPTPSEPGPSITLYHLDELEKMYEMMECEDERELQAYLSTITGGGARNRRDLVGFLDLVQSTPYAHFVDGELTYLCYQKASEQYGKTLLVTVEAPNGEWVRCRYLLSVNNVDSHMDSVKREAGSKNRLSAPLTSENGRLTLYTETAKPHASGAGDLITWWGVLDGIVVEIAYYVADMDTVDIASMINTLKISESVVFTFPRFAMANTKFGSFVERPRYQIYATADSPGGNFGQVDSEWMYEEYSDPNAKSTVTVTHQGVEYKLNYQHTMPARYTRQAYHVYRSEYTVAWLDAETGELMSFSPPFNSDEIGEALTQDALVQVANDFFATLVKDPEAYRIEVDYFEQSGFASVKFVRYVGEVPSCDSASISVRRDGQIDDYVLNYLGAMRNAQPVSDSAMKSVTATLENMVSEYEEGTYEIKQYALTPDGTLALDCKVEITYTDSNGRKWGDGAWMLFMLTEP